jgi:hypothetical protein
MALFKHGQTPSDEPFTRFLSPLDVTSEVTTAIGACWHNTPKADRSAVSVVQLARDTFDDVESWWLDLPDRRGFAIVEAMQKAFPPPAELKLRDLGHIQTDDRFQWMMANVPRQSFAQAIFSTWLLLPETGRTARRAADIVRRILVRQLAAVAEDLTTLGPDAK